LADIVEEMSGGRLIINAHPGNEIVPTYEQTEAGRDGVLDMWHSDLGADMALVGKRALLLGASGYPAGTTPDEDFSWYYVGGGLEMARTVFKDYGYPIGLMEEGQEIFAHSHKPLDTIESLNGLKFRTIGFWAEVMGTFGVSVVTISGAEVYPAAEKGVIDAFEYSGPAVNWPMGFHEIMEYMGTPGIHSPAAGHPITANFDSWNNLPDDLKALLMAAIQKCSQEWYLSLIVEDSKALAKYEEYGTKRFTVGDELQAEIAKRSLDITNQYIAEEPGFKEVWDNKLAYVKLYKEGKKATSLKYSIFQ
jgi:TRAP-type mannitol/chloroaromatic compound transport system substrate-binding protein